MAWKKALFLGGAVLLLAACNNSATAPNSLVRGGSKAAAIRVIDDKPVSQTMDVETQTLMSVEECRSGYYVRSGDKDVCQEIPQ